MIVLFRNFFRNKMVNLTAKSVRHFVPDARMYCISLYKNSEEEYNTQEPLNENIAQIYFRTMFVNKENKPSDHIDSTKTSGYQNIYNGKYFVEGYNIGFSLFKNVDEPVLILAEDHFFTTGKVLKELTSNSFDLAYAPWDNDHDANGSVISINFFRLSRLFPLKDPSGPIEAYLQRNLVSQVSSDRKYAIKHRRHLNYFGDGLYTNSSAEIEENLKREKII